MQSVANVISVSSESLFALRWEPLWCLGCCDGTPWEHQADPGWCWSLEANHNAIIRYIQMND